MTEEPGIVFSVKELIGRLDGKLDTITNILTTKADRADFIVMDHRMSQMEITVKQLSEHEQTRLDNTNETLKKKHYIIATVIASVAAMSGVAAAVFEGTHR